jgi:hypothetical protein
MILFTIIVQGVLNTKKLENLDESSNKITGPI